MMLRSSRAGGGWIDNTCSWRLQPSLDGRACMSMLRTVRRVQASTAGTLILSGSGALSE